jgi:8-oxo-dGTP diphosphatase
MKTVKATVGAIVTQGDTILLELRNHEPFYNHWCIPGGHIDFGETVESAVCREVAEETGLEVLEHTFFDYYTEYYPELAWHAVALVFVVEVQGELERQEKEVKQLRWFSPAEIRDLELAFEHGHVLRDYLEKIRGM